jgi:hypothetical protein
MSSRGMNLDSLHFKPGEDLAIAKSRHNVARYVAFEYDASVLFSLFSMLHRINDISVATPSAMVVTCLLTNIGRGLGRKEMIDMVKWLREEIVKRGGRPLFVSF